MKELKIRDSGRNFSMLTTLTDKLGKVGITRYGKLAYVIMTAEEYSRFAGEEWQIMEKLRKGVWLLDEDDAICKLQLAEDFLKIFKKTRSFLIDSASIPSTEQFSVFNSRN